MSELNWNEADILPGIVDRISSNKSGGWSLRIDIPESAAEIVKRLIGTENKIVYAIGFLSTGEELECAPKRKPGRPKNAEE